MTSCSYCGDRHEPHCQGGNVRELIRPAATDWAKTQSRHLDSLIQLREATAKARQERVLTPLEANTLDDAICTLHLALAATSGLHPTLRGGL